MNIINKILNFFDKPKFRPDLKTRFIEEKRWNGSFYYPQYLYRGEWIYFEEMIYGMKGLYYSDDKVYSDTIEDAMNFVKTKMIFSKPTEYVIHENP